MKRLIGLLALMFISLISTCQTGGDNYLRERDFDGMMKPYHQFFTESYKGWKLFLELPDRKTMFPEVIDRGTIVYVKSDTAMYEITSPYGIFDNMNKAVIQNRATVLFRGNNIVDHGSIIDTIIKYSSFGISTDDTVWIGSAKNPNRGYLLRSSRVDSNLHIGMKGLAKIYIDALTINKYHANKLMYNPAYLGRGAVGFSQRTTIDTLYNGESEWASWIIAFSPLHFSGNGSSIGVEVNVHNRDQDHGYHEFVDGETHTQPITTGMYLMPENGADDQEGAGPRPGYNATYGLGIIPKQPPPGYNHTRWHIPLMIGENATTHVGTSILLGGGSADTTAPNIGIKFTNYHGTGIDFSPATFASNALKFGPTQTITDGTTTKTITQLASKWNTTTFGIAYTLGFVGIGTTSPNKTLDVTGSFNVTGKTNHGDSTMMRAPLTILSTDAAPLNIYSYQTNPTICFRRFGGTYLSPTAIATANNIGSTSVGGCTNADGSIASYNSFKNVTSEAWTKTATGFYSTFSTVPAGSTIITERLRISDSGNIGIGVVNPRSKLHIKVGTDQHILLYSSTSLTYPAITFLKDDYSTYQKAFIDALPLSLNTYSLGNILMCSNGGNVGAGTVLPTANFQVSQPTIGIGTITITTNTTCTGTNTQFLNTFKVGDNIIITATGETRTISAIASNTVMTIMSATNTVASAYTLVGGDRLSVLGNGNIGVGTINPGYLLDIAGTVRFKNKVYLPINTGEIVAGVGITSVMLASDMRYNGTSAIDITANPQIAAGVDGQEISIVGLSDVNTLKFDTGTGLRLSTGTSCTLGLGDVIAFRYIASLNVWIEIYRRDNQ